MTLVQAGFHCETRTDASVLVNWAPELEQAGLGAISSV